MSSLTRHLSILAAAFVCAVSPIRAQLAIDKPFDPFGADALATAAVAEPEPVTVDFVSDVTAIAPGEPFTVAIRFTHEDGWHTYWRNSGFVQSSPEVTWKLPEGFVAGELRWPLPQRGELQGSQAYYYDGVNHLLAEITPPDNLKVGSTVAIAADVQWQHCDELSCVQGTAALSRELPVAEAAEIDPAARELFDEIRAEKLPQALSGWTADAYSNAQGIQLVITPGEGANPDPDGIHFLSADKQIDAQAEQKVVAENGRIVLQLQRNADYKGEKPSTLPGVLYAENGWLEGEPAPVAFSIAPDLHPGKPPVGAVDPLGGRSLGLILLFALVGGLILNLMPCVFPVIGLKIMGFVNQAGEDRRKITFHGVMFTIGVLVSFWILAGIVFALRDLASSPATGDGANASWGFQLQSPWFVFALTIVMLALALNMAGIFEIGGGAIGIGSKLTAKSGYLGSFFSGVLATVVATPCSAPFLGTALAATITLPAVPFFAIFTAIAIGLALPYIILSIFPGLIKLLPKPGAWMESFKQGMSFLLFATVGFMIWIYGGLVEDMNLLLALIGLTCVAAALWIYGRWGTLSRRPATRTRSAIFALAFLAGGIWLGHPKPNPLDWQAWSAQAVASAIEEGRPVYIDFTARWCATCQTNKASYTDSDVQRLVDDKNILLLKADKTKPVPAIDRALAAYGQGPIPVNVLYLPGSDQPKILPKLLTPGVVLDYFEQLPAPETKS